MRFPRGAFFIVQKQETGEMPDPEETAVAPEASVTPPTPAVEAPADDFDKERAMATITKLRAFETTAKAQLKELEALKADKAKRDLAEMTELEREKAERAQLQEQYAAAQAQLKRATLKETAADAAQKASLTFAPGALADALALGVFDALEWADDKPKGMTQAIKDLFAARPYLFVIASASGDIGATQKGKAQNGTDLSSLAGRWGIKVE